ncbi:MAG: M48 family metallopeptidase [Candidatus Norongarragalinales archaeon]
MPELYNQIADNKRKSWLFVVFLFVLVALAVLFFSLITGFGKAGFIIAFFIALLTTVGSYYWSDSIVIASTGAKPAEGVAFRKYHSLVEGLCIASGLPKPRLYYLEDNAINAFATGRDPKHAVVCVTTGAMQKLDKSELEGVIAHELSHVKNYDVRFITFAVVMVGLVSILADMAFRTMFYGRGDRKIEGRAGAALLVIGLLFMILAPIFAKLVQLAVSRKREYLADATGASLTRYPEGLAKALEKIKAEAQPVKNANSATASLFFANPLKGVSLSGLFATHPPVEERIKRLRSM